VWEAIEIANHHPRVNILRPGPGVGGHCIGVDPWFLVEAAPDLTPLIQAARRVNDSQPQFTLQLIRRAFGAQGLAGKTVVVLGLAYKPDVDDLRESPAIEVARLLMEGGAIVRAYEPFKPRADVAGIHLEPTLEAAIQNVDLLALMVPHTPLVGLNPEYVAGLTPGRLAVDAVNGWPRQAWEAAGFQVFRLGVGAEGDLQ
jgi:UDP-N-acetyl-D-mannosaminuronic acid dehydrogenase